MTLQETVACLHSLLESAGFDFNAPDVNLAWRVFQEFAYIPFDNPELKSGSVGVEMTHFADRDEELWLGFSRDIHCIPEDGSLLFSTAVGCDFSTRVPNELVAVYKTLNSTGFTTLEEFFAFVEGQPEFQRCLQIKTWKWEKTRWFWEEEDIEENS